MKALVCMFVIGIGLTASSLFAQDVETQLSGSTATQGFTVKDNSSNTLMTVRGNGNVGIGTALPTAGLEVKQSGTGRAAFFHIDNVSSTENAVLAETQSTSASSDALQATAVGGRALYGQSSGAGATAYLSNNGDGRAVYGANNSSTVPAMTAINSSPTANAPVLTANSSGEVFRVDREGDVTAGGIVTANAMTATTTLNNGVPAAGRMYRDNVVYVWGKVRADGTFTGQSFGIQSVTRNSDTTYTITFQTTFTSVDDYAVVVSPVNNATFEIATPLPISANSVKVKIQYVSFSPSNIIRRDFYDEFFIIVTGRP